MAGSLENAMVLSSTTDEDEKQRESRSKREIISTLPTEKGWKIQGLMYQYQGFWYYSGGAVEGVMWMQNASRQGMKMFSWYDFSAHPLLTSSPHELVPFLEFYAEQNIPFPDLDTLSSPQLYHTHIALTSLPQPVIDSQLVPLEEAFELFCKGISFYGPFWDHVLGYWKDSLASPQRILFMKYEDVKRDSLCQVKRLAEFMGFPFSSEEEGQGLIHEIMELCSFENLRNLKVNKTGAISVGNVSTGKDTFFRKGEVGDWKNHLTAEMADRTDRIMEEKLKDSQCRIVYICRNPFPLKRNLSSSVKGSEEGFLISCQGVGRVHRLPFSPEKKPKIGALSVGDVRFRKDTFFRKGEIGDWKNHLTAEMADRLDRIIEEKFKGSGLTFSDS
ncbi:Cytosolic sulfotransferase 1 [Vitis vinifera]|uniref:Sulfotransferase n=1 Tax=Vitis vinifera TaxID=29760 RepID=A0A438IVD3_VITVI|nr:Cytosolic sulfotransferase 1 [Vitis vinifera]